MKIWHSLQRRDSYDAGTVIWVEAKGKGVYADSSTAVSYVIKKASIAKAKVKIDAQAYTSMEVTLDYDDISVKVAGQELTGGKDYIIISDSYKNNIRKGKATVQIQGIGENYGGTKTVNYTIGRKFFLWRWLP